MEFFIPECIISFEGNYLLIQSGQFKTFLINEIKKTLSECIVGNETKASINNLKAWTTKARISEYGKQIKKPH